MTQRSCSSCQWSEKPEHFADILECREGPPIQRVFPTHWCSRWRARETDCGGRDSRLTNTDNRGTK